MFETLISAQESGTQVLDRKAIILVLPNGILDADPRRAGSHYQTDVRRVVGIDLVMKPIKIG